MTVNFACVLPKQYNNIITVVSWVTKLSLGLQNCKALLIVTNKNILSSFLGKEGEGGGCMFHLQIKNEEDRCSMLPPALPQKSMLLIFKTIKT
jgi:hypothetical protein